ncbi:MAG: DASH complex subunit Dad2 [Lasallia pustulata]|uniref:DASH complex subunit Dad2 n=1 Tax=Lasallia pustulata TaxID=136370 RepID=A0A5M8PP20_9LECA|nr:MAG: DASH complex subunit Dad2 [Lasallia pustulata]
MPTPSIACIGVIGKHDNPLHIALFPPHSSAPGAHLEFSFLLNSTLDIFDLRTRQNSNTSVDQDLGLLQAVDERLSCWGWETGTGIRMCIVVDMFGKDGVADGQVMGLRDGELKPAFRALQTAYIHLLRNPFYMPDEHNPITVANGRGKGGEITSRRFIAEVKRIGETWAPGVTKL